MKKINLKKFLPYLSPAVQESVKSIIDKESEIDEPYIKRTVVDNELKIDKDEPRIVLATISSVHLDRDQEIVLSKGVNVTPYKLSPVLLYSHNWGGIPLGKALNTKVYEDRIRSKFKFDEDEIAELIFSKYKSGSLTSFSVGIAPLQIVFNGTKEFGKIADQLIENGYVTSKDIDNTMDIISKSILLEVSSVPLPSNIHAVAEDVSKDSEEKNEKTERIEVKTTESTGEDTEKTTEKEEAEAEVIEKLRNSGASGGASLGWLPPDPEEEKKQIELEAKRQKELVEKLKIEKEIVEDKVIWKVVSRPEAKKSGDNLVNIGLKVTEELEAERHKQKGGI